MNKRLVSVSGVIALLGFLALTLAGCVERKMVITSEPSGADVWINEQWHGKTPYELSFKHYGVFSVRLEAKGYYPMYVKEPVPAPLYQQPGLDLISEAAIPGTIRDNRSMHYVMQKIEGPDPVEDVLGRADDMITRTDEIIVNRRVYDSQRDPVDLPFLPEKNEGSVEDAQEVRKQLAVDTMNMDYKKGKSMDTLEPIGDIE